MPLPLDFFVVGAREPEAIMAEYARLTGHPEMPPLWAFGYQQSHRTLASREEILQEAKTFREKKLPCETLHLSRHRLLSVRLEHRQRRVRVQPEGVSRSAGDDPSAARRSLQGGAAHRPRGRTLSGAIERRVHGGAAAERPDAGRHAGPTIAQVSCYWPVHKPLRRCRRRWLVARSGRRPRSGCHVSREIGCITTARGSGGPTSGRSHCTATAARACSAIGAFLWSGDVYSTWETLKTHVPVAINTSTERHPVLGHRHRRVRADEGVHRRALRALVSVRRLLPAVSARTAARGSFVCPGDGTPASLDRTRFRPTTGGAANPIRVNCTTPRSSRSAANASNCDRG